MSLFSDYANVNYKLHYVCASTCDVVIMYLKKQNAPAFISAKLHHDINWTPCVKFSSKTPFQFSSTGPMFRMPSIRQEPLRMELQGWGLGFRFSQSLLRKMWTKGLSILKTGSTIWTKDFSQDKILKKQETFLWAHIKMCLKSFVKSWPLRNQDSEACFIQIGFVLEPSVKSAKIWV